MNSLQQSSSEEFVASRISKSLTGWIRLLESIPERKNMQRVLHFARYVEDCVIFVRSERGGKRVMKFPIIRARLPLDPILPDQPNRHLRTRTSGGVGGAPREGRPYPDPRTTQYRSAETWSLPYAAAGRLCCILTVLFVNSLSVPFVLVTLPVLCISSGDRDGVFESAGLSRSSGSLRTYRRFSFPGNRHTR